ncbi:MAG: hypothetical protein PHF86_05730 [Candidatus Nanoarchaeia archaeon]|nr:hypothetical protein [Candidatus Nanoarchaeia archaeon]
MGLKEKLSACEIVSKIGMSMRPEFYSGNGARIDYLNHLTLEKLYKEIESGYGRKAAQNYVQMVADIPVLYPTDFLLSLYKLEARDWKWEKSMLGNEKGIYAGDFITGAVTTISILANSTEIDETRAIRDSFLRNHGIEIKEEKNNYNN